MNLARITIKRPVATLMFFLAVALVGALALARLSVDLLPDLSFPMFTVRTVYPQAAPNEVENRVTRRIEEAVSSIAGLRSMHSISKEGVSLVHLEFYWGSNMDFAALHVREKLDQLRWSLPPEVERPTIIQLDPSAEPIMVLALGGEDLSQTRLFAENVLKRRLEQIRGIALASVTGGTEREIHVDLDLQALAALQLNPQDMAQALQQANVSLPGGTVLGGRYRYSLRIRGVFESVADIRNVAIAHRSDGSAVRLDQVAAVHESIRERNGLNRLNQNEAVAMLLVKESGFNTVQVAAEAQTVLQQIRKEYPEIEISLIDDQSRIISLAIDNVSQAILYGGVLAVLVLFFFLHDVRSPLSIAVSIPISVLAAFILFMMFDVNLNIMSLGGLALGIGLLVDNSIVVLENSMRLRESDLSLSEAAARGAGEVAMPLLASTLTTVAVFLPIAFVEGVAGQLFRDQALAVTFSLLASLVVSLTLLPVLIARSMPERAARKKQANPSQSSRLRRILSWPWRQVSQGAKWGSRGVSRAVRPVFGFSDGLLQKIQRVYESQLDKNLAHAGRTLFSGAGLFILTLVLALWLRYEFMPQMPAQQLVMDIRLPEGTALDYVSESAAAVEAWLASRPEIDYVFSQVGWARHGSEMARSDQSIEQIHLVAQPKPSDPDMIGQLKKELEQHLSLPAGSEYTFDVSEGVVQQLLDLDEGDIRIELCGEDLETLSHLADDLRHQVERIPGIGHVWSDIKAGAPEIRVQIDTDLAGRMGLSAQAIADYIRTSIQGVVATELQEFDKKIDIRLKPAFRESDLAALFKQQIRPGVAIGSLVRVDQGRSLMQILRQNQARTITLFATVKERSVGAVVNEIRQHTASLALPGGYELHVGGMREEMNRSFNSLAMALAAQFESFKHPFVILLSVPMAWIGVIWLLWITSTSVNVLSLIGVIVLTGIAVNDAIIKISFINQLRREGMDLVPAIHQAGRMRLRPILMTTATTILGLLPLALALGPGADMGRPLAIAIIGGLVTSTWLTLFVVPVIYYVMEKRQVEL